MPLLLALLTVIGLLALWWWRARAGRKPAGPADPVGADAVREALRRFRYRQETGRHPAETVEDPRLAAAGVMAAVMRLKGELTPDQLNQLRVECRAAFRVAQAEADEIAAVGRWLASQSDDPEDAIRRLLPVIRDRAEPEAHADLARMLERVAAVEGGGPNDRQRAVVAQARKALDVA